MSKLFTNLKRIKNNQTSQLEVKSVKPAVISENLYTQVYSNNDMKDLTPDTSINTIKQNDKTEEE